MDQIERVRTIQQEQSGPDWAYWARMPGWLYSEGAALLLHLDPFNEEQNEQDAEYRRLVFLLRRARDMGQLESPLRPLLFLNWAMDNGIDVSEDILDIVARSETLIDWKARARRYRRELNVAKSKLKKSVGEELNPKSKTSLLRMIYVVALRKYNYKPGRNNSAATNIYNDIEKYGSGLLSEQTIRDWLKVAEDEIGYEFDTEDGN